MIDAHKLRNGQRNPVTKTPGGSSRLQPAQMERGLLTQPQPNGHGV
jgi:hypothetical protein